MFPVRTVRPLCLRGGGAAESTVSGRSGSHSSRRGNSARSAAHGPTTPATPGTTSAASTLTFTEPSTPATATKKSSMPEPPTPRPTITIYTALDEESTDTLSAASRLGADGSTAAAATVPYTPGVPCTQVITAVTSSGGDDGGHDSTGTHSAKALHPTITALSPEHHVALYGNGLVGPDRDGSLARTLAHSRETSFHADTSRCLSSLATPLGRSLRSRYSSAATFDDEEALEKSFTSGVRYSATPVVPLHVGADAHYRRDAALKFKYRIDKAAAETAALAAQAEVERREKEAAAKALERANAQLSKKEREKKEKKEKKESEKRKQGESRAAPPAHKLTGRALKEYLVRVGIERINQRTSEFHFQLHRVRNDGNCQFRAISHQLFGSEAYHDIVRSHVIAYMRSVRAEQFDFYFESKTAADEYFDRVATPGAWGDELTLRGASDSLQVNIHILSSETKNCFITYRPSESAPPPPSFLVDVTTLRERRQLERSLMGKPASRLHSRVSSGLHPRGDSGPGAREGSASAIKTTAAKDGVEAVAGDEDEADAIDVLAIQQALERRLQKASIVSATPCVSSTNSLATSFARPTGLAVTPPTPLLPPPPIPNAAPTDRLAELQDVAGDGARSDLDKFTQAGATVRDGVAAAEDVSFLLPRPGKAAVMPLEPTARVPGPLLPPHTPISPTTPGSHVGEGSCVQSPLQKRASPTSSFGMCSQNQGASVPESYPSFLTREGGHVLLVAAPKTRHSQLQRSAGTALDETEDADSAASQRPSQNRYGGSKFLEVPSADAGGVPWQPHSPAAALSSPTAARAFDVATNASSHTSEMDVGVCFAFEKRTEPIDIFLSYLYPVHYNSIELTENSFASPTSAPGPGDFPATSDAAIATAPAAPPEDSFAAERSFRTISSTTSATSSSVQHFVTVPFLKPQQP